MSRHVNWGIIMILGVLIVAAATSPQWIDFVEPLNESDGEAQAGFVCPPVFQPEICTALTELNEEDPVEAEVMVNALQGDPVPAPANEQDPDSVESEVDPNTVSVFTNTRIRTGTFEELSELHWATGTVNLIELVADDTIQRWVRFENTFEVAQGPDLRVYLSVNPEPITAEGMLANDTAVLVGLLKGNVGGQNYKLDSAIDITQFASVVIFSEQFQRIFSYATLQQPIN